MAGHRGSGTVLTSPWALVMVIAALAAMALLWQVSRLPASVVFGQPATLPKLTDAAAERDKSAAAVLARPLFSPSRRPARDEDTATAASLPPAQPRLTGVVTSRDGEEEAIVDPGDGSPSLTLRPGEQLNGQTILSITPEGVRLQGAQGAYTIRPGFNPLAALPPIHSDHEK